MSEKKAISGSKKQVRADPGPIRFKDSDDGDIVQVTLGEQAAAATLRMTGVYDSSMVTTRFITDALRVMKPLFGKRERASDVNDVAILLHNIAPRDAVEGMLAVQIIATHSAAMRCLRLAERDGQTPEVRDMHLKHATKLLRAYTAQVEALGKYRNKAKQTVIVKHVHVHEGGQAIVGNVERGEGGGGET